MWGNGEREKETPGGYRKGRQINKSETHELSLLHLLPPGSLVNLGEGKGVREHPPRKFGEIKKKSGGRGRSNGCNSARAEGGRGKVLDELPLPRQEIEMEIEMEMEVEVEVESAKFRENKCRLPRHCLQKDGEQRDRLEAKVGMRNKDIRFCGNTPRRR